jgi:hypothetical protein
MLRVGQTLEQAVSCAEGRKGDLRAMDQWSESFAMALARFAEEDSFDAAAGVQSFFNEADAFHTDATGFGR